MFIRNEYVHKNMNMSIRMPNEYVHKNALLSKTQFGFRNKFSTTDALVYLTEKIRCNKNEKKIRSSIFRSIKSF